MSIYTNLNVRLFFDLNGIIDYRTIGVNKLINLISFEI